MWVAAQPGSMQKAEGRRQKPIPEVSACCLLSPARRAGYRASGKYNAAMNVTRRAALGAITAAAAGTLVDPGPVLARIAADVPCSAPAGTLIGTLPLFRDRSQAQPFGVK